MPGSDWKSHEAYANMEKADAAGLAWESLRRNADYQRDYAALKRGASRAMTGELRRRWGLSFRG